MNNTCTRSSQRQRHSDTQECHALDWLYNAEHAAVQLHVNERKHLLFCSPVLPKTWRLQHTLGYNGKPNSQYAKLPNALLFAIWHAVILVFIR